MGSGSDPHMLMSRAAVGHGQHDMQEHARDSFENVLFSLCRFYELTGHYPAAITAVSYTLKQRRFEEVHRAAVRFPASNFTFIGTPVPPAAKGAEAVGALGRVYTRGCAGIICTVCEHQVLHQLLVGLAACMQCGFNTLCPMGT